MFYTGGPLPSSMMSVIVLVGSLSALAMICFVIYLRFQHKRQKKAARRRHKTDQSPPREGINAKVEIPL